MFKMNLRRVCGLLLVLFVAGFLATGCYDDSELRASIDNLKSQLDQLKTLVSTLQNDDAVTGVTQNADGSYTITFKKSGSVTIRNGKDGENGTPGKDGKDGKDGSIINVVKGGETYTFYFSDGTTLVLPRYSETRVLTFEDADYKGSAEIINYWTSLVDEPEYGGPILYGTGCNWNDENNTFISGLVSPYDPASWSGGLSGGGIAISNYGCNTLTDRDFGYLQQLEVINVSQEVIRKGAGANGSDNFAVVYDGGAWGTNPAALYLGDQARYVESVMVNNTSYTWHVLIYGNTYCSPLAPSDGFFKATATGYLDGTVTGTSEFFLAKNGIVYSDWRKWDLSGLGEVDKIVFSLSGSEELYGEYGFNAPTYFAIDDITVRVYPD